jgi:hypothetical protein
MIKKKEANYFIISYLAFVVLEGLVEVWPGNIPEDREIFSWIYIVGASFRIFRSIFVVYSRG